MAPNLGYGHEKKLELSAFQGYIVVLKLSVFRGFSVVLLVDAFFLLHSPLGKSVYVFGFPWWLVFVSLLSASLWSGFSFV